VWLDRGELDKIVAMSRQSPGGEATPGQDRSVAGPGFLEQGYASFGHPRHDRDHDNDHSRDRERGQERHRRDEHERDHGHAYGRRRESWLGELFGGDD
jgi:Zn-finger nucleic acid-binding protein